MQFKKSYVDHFILIFEIFHKIPYLLDKILGQNKKKKSRGQEGGSYGQQRERGKGGLKCTRAHPWLLP